MTAAELREAPSECVVRVRRTNGMTNEGYGYLPSSTGLIYHLRVGLTIDISRSSLANLVKMQCCNIASITALRRTADGWVPEEEK